ncbi:nicotinamide riboside transporter PnuC [Wenzhouxiangella sediminis]|uniref:Nicotinamide riboside transporter PnuC n=1 Tax=Wenzhouxiangella sediminis TaxID=1792836 RepID=A0A3E1K7E2_9GAMM|nr:nicotinamide riboside transporter PnuC [Wenzhouxiangella sediminis]RFF29950.1 nicotinamide riboside transporter PnuC [Wenzhouxiangella sediminis]
MTLNSWLEQLAQRWAQMSGWELAAVVLAVAYLLLAVRQNRWCWAAAFVSTAIFTLLFWHVQLVMQSALNGYYMAMAVYGWWHWQHGDGGDETGGLPIHRWGAKHHAVALGVITACALASGYLLDRHSDAAWPYLDSFVTWAAVVTTFMVARKVLDNWAYWMVINSLAIVLFVDRGMALTALLHATYLVISVFGWISWVRDYRRQPAETAVEPS